MKIVAQSTPMSGGLFVAMIVADRSAVERGNEGPLLFRLIHSRLLVFGRSPGWVEEGGGQVAVPQWSVRWHARRVEQSI